MRCKVAILGSCVTRDAFSFQPSTPWEVTAFVARTSFISMAAPALAADVPFAAPNPFEARCIRADFDKSTWSILESEFDYLIIDLIDERFDLWRIGDGVVLATVTMTQSGILDAFPPATRIPRLEPDTTAAWMRDCATFCRRLRRTVDPARVILHRARHASHFRTAGTLHPFTGFHAGFAARHNPLLTTYYACLQEHLPEAHGIEMPSQLVLADGAHPWGRQPFHYVPEYYAGFMQCLGAIRSSR